MFGQPQQGDPNLTQSIRYLEDRVRRLEEAGGGATRVLTNVALTVGSNTIPHGLGRTPTTWWVGAPEGAFPSGGGGGGGASLYLNPSPPRASASSDSTFSSGVATHTMQFTPADGSTLVALVGFESGPGNQVSSITQTGVTWTRLTGPLYASTNNSEVWVGSVSSGASAIAVINYASAFTSATDMLLIVEIPEISSTTPTALAYHATTTTNFPDRHYDTSQNFTTPPVPNAGDIVLTATYYVSGDMPVSHGWPCIGALDIQSTAYGDAQMFMKVAQEAEHQPFRAVASGPSAGTAIHQVCFPATLTQLSGGGGGGDAAHGFREVSSDATNIVIESLSNVTVDLIVR